MRTPEPDDEVGTPMRTSDFDAFFHAHYASLVRSLTALHGDAAAADEAVQDAFTKAYARWRRVRNMDLPAAWVRRVAINRLRDLHRAAERRRRAEDRAAGAQATTTDLGPGGFDEIVELLAPLPDRQRAVMALFYVEDLPIAEIAASLRISKGAVKAHLSQGRANVAKSLAGSNREEER